jgi:NAD-dependent dihydropyrimidine dehydrogenase PreA subunit
MYSVDMDKCSGCGLCVQACPQGAINIQTDIAVIDYRFCSQCGNCAEECSTGAIIRKVEPVYAQSVKGGEIVIGRGWFGRGYRARGRGNAYAFWRFYPWLPRRWWVYGRGTYPQISLARGPVYRPCRWW